jgi:hypothetical protein
VPQLNGSFVELMQAPPQHSKPGIVQSLHSPPELLVAEAEVVELDVVTAALELLGPVASVVATLAVELPPDAPAPEVPAPEVPAPPVPTTMFPPQPSSRTAAPAPRKTTFSIGRAYPCRVTHAVRGAAFDARPIGARRGM